jgi:hypothetical protein
VIILTRIPACWHSSMAAIASGRGGKMITGDHQETAMAIGQMLGIGNSHAAITGYQLEPRRIHHAGETQQHHVMFQLIMIERGDRRSGFLPGQQTPEGAEPIDRDYWDAAITTYASEGLRTVAAAWIHHAGETQQHHVMFQLIMIERGDRRSGFLPGRDVLLTGAPDVLLNLCQQQQTPEGAEPIDRDYWDAG